jgi:hypothetical protein
VVVAMVEALEPEALLRAQKSTERAYLSATPVPRRVVVFGVLVALFVVSQPGTRPSQLGGSARL